MQIRTDIASEIRDRKMKEYSVKNEGRLDGVICLEEETDEITKTRIDIVSSEGERIIGKPCGAYITLDISRARRLGAQGFVKTADLIASELAGLIKGGSVLAVGLGNADMTADALGPSAAKRIIATRHIKEREEVLFGKAGFGDVAVLIPGVLAETGMEAAVQIENAVRELDIDNVILIDSLASGNISALNNTVQITDTGICPGSGVGNDRGEISKKTLGVNTVAIGVPTIVDTATLILSAYGDEALPDCARSAADRARGCYVCSKDAGRAVYELGKTIGYAVNKLCHKDIPYDEMAYM